MDPYSRRTSRVRTKCDDISEEVESCTSHSPMPPSCDESVSPTTSGSAVVEDKVPDQKKDTDEEIECARGAEVQNSPEIDSEPVELPKRVFARSISECEVAADDSQRSILRNPQVTEIRSILEKRQSFDLPAEGRPSVNVGSEQDVIERYYQRNQATINSLQSRALEPVRRTRETRHPVSLASRRSGQSEVIMPSPKVTERKNFAKSFYWVAANHKKIGFRHICMLLLVLIYTLLGALLFYLIESDYERNVSKPCILPEPWI
ncbi:unnamed protein product [Haemonchus placei]|uniref:LEM domain-containing protein n=1 Tax=Haemonchus placei TaxID=6290 RepID=A0A0N4WV36_HAEPC|nr:unnamed protein product [Haemonchus placei]